MNKYLITLAGVTILGGGLLFAGGKALAEEVTTSYPLIVQNIAEKFGLDAAEVQTVFTETREEEHATRLEEGLSTLVEDGVITEDQKSLIKAKMEEFHTARENLDLESMTMAERRSAMEQLRTDLKTWAEENDIPTNALMEFGPMGGRGRGGMGEIGMGGPGFDPELTVE